MRGVLTVFRKELTDHFASKKFLILLALVYIAGLASTYVALQNIRDVASALDQFVFLKLYTTGGEVLPSFISFISFFIPIIGIIFGFDAINSERNSGNLSRLMSQPIYRDSVIKLRIFFLIFICVFYGGFWMGLSILFSVIMERTAASILTAIAIWIFMMFFLPIIANAIANAIAPLEGATAAVQVQNYSIEQGILRISPSTLFTETIAIVL
jgi:ABC-2 type transport system permease protein